MKKQLFLFLFLFGIFSPLFAYRILVKIDGYQGKEVYLAYYFGSKTYVADTAEVSGGIFEFKSGEELPPGIYLIALENSGGYFEFIYNGKDPYLLLTTRMEGLSSYLNSTGSEETLIFVEYIKAVDGIRKRSEKFDKILNDSGANKTSEEYKSTAFQKEALNAEYSNLVKSTIREHPGSLTAKLLKAQAQMEFPASIQSIPDKDERQSKIWSYYRAHYFDDFDIGDLFFRRTPLLDKKINTYLDDSYSMGPDSAEKSIDRLMQMATRDAQTYQYFAIHVMNFAATTKIVCMDRVYVYVVDKYYFHHSAPFGGASWLDGDSRKKIQDNVNRLRPMLCGLKGPALQVLPLGDGNQQVATVGLDALPGKFVLLVVLDGAKAQAQNEGYDLLKPEDPSKFPFVATMLRTQLMNQKVNPGDLSVVFLAEEQPPIFSEMLNRFRLPEVKNWYYAPFIQENIESLHLYSPALVKQTTYLLGLKREIYLKSLEIEKVPDYIKN